MCAAAMVSLSHVTIRGVGAELWGGLGLHTSNEPSFWNLNGRPCARLFVRVAGLRLTVGAGPLAGPGTAAAVSAGP